MRQADPSVDLDLGQAAVADAGMKAMMPIGHPFLDYVLSGLADAGYREACLVIGPEHETVRDHYTREVTPRRIRISFAVQEEPCGTADAVLTAEAFVEAEPFLVINADNHYPVEACRALRLLGEAGLAAFARDTLAREGDIPAERVARWPVVKADTDGYLVELVGPEHARARREAGEDVYVSMNCWMFTPAIFQACRAIAPSARGELELPDAVRYAMSKLGARFRVLTFRLPVLDLTSRADVAAVAERLRRVEVNL